VFATLEELRQGYRRIFPASAGGSQPGSDDLVTTS